MTKPVISLKPSYNSVIRGCPGLPDTLARIECEFRIRSSDSEPFYIKKIEISLKTVESLNGQHSITSKPKIEKVTSHYKKSVKLSENSLLLGLDLPVTIALPDDIKETNYNTNFGKCVTYLECNVHYRTTKHELTKSEGAIESLVETINVEKYVYLASKKLFPPIRRIYTSADKRFEVNLKIDNPCLTTDDLIKLSLEFKLSTAAGIAAVTSQKGIFIKKIKLKSISYQIKEYLEVNNASAGDSKENILCEYNQLVDQVISLNPIKVKSNICVSTKNQYFKEFETTMQEPAFLYKLPSDVKFKKSGFPNTNINTKLYQNKTNGLIPLQYHTSITTMGSLFSVKHVLRIKFKIGNSKDFEIHHPIDISPWPTTQIKYIEQIIEQEKEIAYHAKNFYDNYGGIKRNKHTGELEYPALPPTIYPASDSTLEMLGIYIDNNRDKPRRIPLIE